MSFEKVIADTAKKYGLTKKHIEVEFILRYEGPEQYDIWLEGEEEREAQTVTTEALPDHMREPISGRVVR